MTDKGRTAETTTPVVMPGGSRVQALTRVSDKGEIQIEFEDPGVAQELIDYMEQNLNIQIWVVYSAIPPRVERTETE